MNPTTATRNRIATELLHNCPQESRADHEAIARAIRADATLKKLLDMPEVDRWPETYSWLKTKMTPVAEQCVAYDRVTEWMSGTCTEQEAKRFAKRHNDGCAKQGGYGSAEVYAVDAEGYLRDSDGNSVWRWHGQSCGAVQVETATTTTKTPDDSYGLTPEESRAAALNPSGKLRPAACVNCRTGRCDPAAIEKYKLTPCEYAAHPNHGEGMTRQESKKVDTFIPKKFIGYETQKRGDNYWLQGRSLRNLLIRAGWGKANARIWVDLVAQSGRFRTVNADFGNENIVGLLPDGREVRKVFMPLKGA